MSREKLADLAAVAPLIVWYVFAIGGLLLQIEAQISKPADSIQLALSVSAKLASSIFFGVQILLFAIRSLPEGKAEGWQPRLAALLGFGSAYLLLALPRVEPSPLLDVVSTLLIITGTACSIIIACQLGRSFSVLPQARALVTHGAYSLVRHPLYVVEQIAAFGVMCQFQQPWAFLVFLFSIAMQFPRMHYEELILAQIFPSYGTYASRTARLIPGVY